MTVNERPEKAAFLSTLTFKQGLFNGETVQLVQIPR